MLGDRTDGRVTIDLGRSGGDAQLVFSDNGPGIPADTLPQIFDPYFTTRAEGSGLGLAMVKSIVLLHGGVISAASIEGKGTTFTIRLPLTGPPDEPAAT